MLKLIIIIILLIVFIQTILNLIQQYALYTRKGEGFNYMWHNILILISMIGIVLVHHFL